MRHAIEVVKTYFLAQIATPSATSIKTMRTLASPDCAACSRDLETIVERATKHQHIVRKSGDPTWGGLQYSFRGATGSNRVTVRQQYVQPPLKLVNQDGSVIGGPDVAKVYTFLYVVETDTGVIRSRTAAA